MIDFSDHGDIVTFGEMEDLDGKWWVINGSTYYKQKDWTKEEAIENYKKPDNIMERANALWQTWCG